MTVRASGIVLSVTGRQATVIVPKVPACRRCAAGKGCGAGLGDDREQPVTIELAAPASVVLVPGDEVVLDLDSGSLLHGAWIGYGLPLAGLATGTLVGDWLADTTGMVAGLAFAGLAAGFLCGRQLSRAGAVCHRLSPRLQLPAAGSR